MKHDNESTDLSGLIKPAPVATVEQARDELLAKVLGSQQELSEQFSRIDHPFATDDQIDDYELARDEFQALIRCSIHMPQSVEGIRFLEGWHRSRMEQIDVLLTHAQPGSLLVFGEGTEPVAISKDFSKGMRAGLMLVRAMFQGFPLALETSGDEEEGATT